MNKMIKSFPLYLTISMALSLALISGYGLADSHETVQLSELNEGEQACLMCHDNTKVNAILNTPHFVAADSRSPGANQACENCHGPSKEHSQFPQKIANIRFGEDSTSTPEEQTAPCLTCHQGDHVNWDSSTHAFEDMSCASCHTVHTRRDPVLSPLTETEVCFDCHKQEEMQINKPYRHPTQEGVVACTSCHNPHGSNGPSMLIKQSVNETCHLCHAEKRGPFVNEHEPVQDNCANCHTPHGSNHENLLIVRPPFLCQQCHSDHSHPRTEYSANNLPGAGGGSESRVIGGSCVNCHSQIHGSNTPEARSMRQ